MKFLKDPNSREAFIISFIYVGIGTLAICSVFPSDFFGKFCDWTTPVLIITFPVTIISMGYRWGQSSPLWPVLIIQIIMFLLTYLALKKRFDFNDRR